MKRWWVLLLGIFLSACPSFAQFTTVTGTVQDPNGIPYAGAVLNAVLVPSTGGGYTLSGQPYSGRIGPVTLDSSGSFTVNFGDVTLITPGSPQWQITIDSAAATIGLPIGSGPQSFTYTSTGTTISGSSPVSVTTALASLVPKLTNLSGSMNSSGNLTANFATKAVYAADPQWVGGVFADAKNNCQAAITNTSNQVTVNPAIGTQFTAADQGSMFEGVNSGGGSGCPTAGTVGGTLLISGFICASGGFVNATTVKICTTKTGSTPANATGTCTSVPNTTSCPIQWGQHDDTAAMQAAFNQVLAPGICGADILPSGRIIVTSPILGTTTSCPNINAASTVAMGFRVSGQGASQTVIVPWNSFDAAPCATGGHNSCFFAVSNANAPTGIGLDHFAIDGGGLGTVTNGNNKNIFYMPGPGNYDDITVTEWGSANSNFSAFLYGGNNGDLATCTNCYSYNGGSRCFTSGGVTSLVGQDCFNPQGSIINPGSTQQSCTNLYGGNVITDANNANGGAITVNGGANPGCLQDFGSYLSTQGTGPVVQCGGLCNLDKTTLSGGSAAGAYALFMQDLTGHAGTAHLRNTLLSNPAQVAINGSTAGAILYDECGNTLAGSFTATNISFTACPNGPSIGNVPTLSGTGACATITTQLPATTGGWTGSFKCTGATGASTVTITFGYTAPNGWNLTNAWDQTTVANPLHQNSGGTTTTLIIGAGTVTQNDVITWSATPF